MEESGYAEILAALQELEGTIEAASNTISAVLFVFIGVCLAGFIVSVLSRYIDGS